MIKVAVFDDNMERRKALKMLLSIQPDMRCTGIYKNCVNVIAELETDMPDVVLMDIDMPQVNGIEGVRMIREHLPQVLIIMQTVFEDDDKLFRSIQAGANGYILKKTLPDKLIEGVREVMNGGAPMTSTIASRVLKEFRTQKATTEHPAQEYGNLTNRELEILNLLVKGYSHKLVAAELDVSINTVHNHIANIYKKLQVQNATEVVAFALKRGIVK